MKVIIVILATCLALAAAAPQKRQNTPPAPTSPPTMMMTTDAVDTTDMVIGNDTIFPTMAPVNTTAPGPIVTDKPTDAPTTMPPTTTTAVTQPLMPTKIVSVEEIVQVFEAVSQTDYFKRLSFEDQLLVMEILSGGETGKMTLILEQIGYEHLLNFMYELPLKYVDNFKSFIDQGFVREHSLEK